ncbi:MAG: hypothetical protein QOH53_805, partial [Ilumatobacteraceae bacterium]
MSSVPFNSAWAREYARESRNRARSGRLGARIRLGKPKSRPVRGAYAR